MSTSGTITSTMTARQLVTRAMKDLGIIGAGDTPDSAEMTDGVEVLNWMLKTWQNQGCNLWREARTTATITGGSASVTLSPRPIDVISARHNVSATNERPLTRWESGEYDLLPNKAAVGSPTIYTVRKGISGTTMLVWPVPSTNQTVGYTYARVIEDVTAPDQHVDVPQEYLETVWTNLGVRFGPQLGAARMDPAAFNRMVARAAVLEAQMLDMDRPASIIMGAQR